jgi:hypothetical protein
MAPVEAAQLLGVSPRTVRRWFEGEAVPGPAAAALRAWRKLQSSNLAWRPDSMSIIQDDQEQIALHRNHTVGMAELLNRVEMRGGARIPWEVSIAEHKATLGPIEVGFYLLQSGGFSLSTYTRRDRDPDLTGDWPLIEDAASCIAIELGKWKQCSVALQAVSANIRQTQHIFVTNGRPSLTLAATAERVAQIGSLADRLDQLAAAALVGEADYEKFESLRSALQNLGKQADGQLISDVAFAFQQVRK